MTHQHTDFLIALAGQPNCGKSSLFNALTGAHQDVGNHAGITVEKKSAHYHDGEKRMEVVDLPGMYSLNSTSPEERVARDFILLESPEVIVAVVDASNLRRNLLLLLQLLEMQYPVIVCLNMIDVARRRHVEVDAEKLSKLLGVPVVATVSSESQGIDDLKTVIRQTANETTHRPNQWRISYEPELELWLGELASELKTLPHLMEDFYPRWLAIKLMERDRYARRIIQHHTHDNNWEEILKFYESLATKFEEDHHQTALESMNQTRLLKAAEIVRECVVRSPNPKGTHSDRIDRIVCHPVAGLAVAAVVLITMFQLTFQISDGWNWLPWFNGWNTPVGVMSDIIDERIPNWVVSTFTTPTVLPEDGSSVDAFRQTAWGSLLFDGVLAGVGGVIVFLPVIFTMFSALALLELSGYISRVSLIMDRLLRRFSLEGQSILPLVLGGGIAGGCAVPAIYATRTMENNRQKIITMLVVPFMNCGAKFPVLMLMTTTFFCRYKGLVFCGLIFLAWFFALTGAWIIGKFLVRGPQLPLVLELPSYQVPSLAMVMQKALWQSWQFLSKAGTVILAANMLVWAAMYYPAVDNPELTPLEASYAGRISSAITPVTSLAGFDDKENIALIGGVAAKEIIISTLGTAYELQHENSGNQKDLNQKDQNQMGLNQKGNDEANDTHSLGSRLKSSGEWPIPKVLAFMVFVMLYAPCFATLTVMRRESGTWRWPIISVVLNTTVAFVIAVLIYQLGLLVM